MSRRTRLLELMSAAGLANTDLQRAREQGARQAAQTNAWLGAGQQALSTVAGAGLETYKTLDAADATAKSNRITNLILSGAGEVSARKGDATYTAGEDDPKFAANTRVQEFARREAGLASDEKEQDFNVARAKLIKIAPEEGKDQRGAIKAQQDVLFEGAPVYTIETPGQLRVGAKGALVPVGRKTASTDPTDGRSDIRATPKYAVQPAPERQLLGGGGGLVPAPVVVAPVAAKPVEAPQPSLLDSIRRENAERGSSSSSKARAGRSERPAFDYTYSPLEAARDVLFQAGIDTKDRRYGDFLAQAAGLVEKRRDADETRQLNRYDSNLKTDLLRMEKSQKYETLLRGAEIASLSDLISYDVVKEIQAIQEPAKRFAAIRDYAKNISQGFYDDGSEPEYIGEKQIEGILSKVAASRDQKDFDNATARLRAQGKAKAGGGKAAPLLTQGERQHIASGTATIKVLDDIEREATGALPGGKAQGWAARFGSKFNLGDPKTAAFIAKIDRQTSAYLKFLSGAGVTESEYNRVVAASPNINDSPEVFGRKLKDFRSEVVGQRNELLRAAQKAGVNIGDFNVDDDEQPAEKPDLRERAAQLRAENPTATKEQLKARLTEEGY